MHMDWWTVYFCLNTVAWNLQGNIMKINILPGFAYGCFSLLSSIDLILFQNLKLNISKKYSPVKQDRLITII